MGRISLLALAVVLMVVISLADAEPFFFKKGGGGRSRGHGGGGGYGQMSRGNGTHVLSGDFVNTPILTKPNWSLDPFDPPFPFPF